MNKKFVAIIIAALIIISIGIFCVAHKNKSAEHIETLTGKTWVWEKTVAQDGSTIAPKKQGAFTVTFGADGHVAGTTDCNGFFGSYELNERGSAVKFGNLASTLMFCDGSQEAVFTSAIANADHFAINESGNLLVTLSGGKGTMEFTLKK